MLWLKLNGFLILCLGVGLSISVEIVNVIYPRFWMVPCGFFFYFFQFFGGWVGGGGGSIFTDEYKSNVYVFENKNVLSDILCWFWDNTLWLKLNGFLIVCLGVGLSISVEIVHVIYPGFWMVPCGFFFFFFFSIFFLGGAVITDEYKSNVYVFEKIYCLTFTSSL